MHSNHRTGTSTSHSFLSELFNTLIAGSLNNRTRGTHANTFRILWKELTWRDDGDGHETSLRRVLAQHDLNVVGTICRLVLDNLQLTQLSSEKSKTLFALLTVISQLFGSTEQENILN